VTALTARLRGTAGGQPEPSVLFDAPGPRARLRNNALTLLGAIGLLIVAYFVYARFSEAGQWQADLWTPFLRADVWTGMILPGLLQTLAAAALGMVLALLFGIVFGLGRLSEHAWIRLPCGAVVEFFRAIPVLLMIMFAQAGWFEFTSQIVINLPPAISGQIPPTMPAFVAVVIGLVLYNGSVLAEVFRAGVYAVPKGQSEAAYAIGLRKGGVMRLVLLPQAVTAMMPAIISQMVVLLKDTALGYIIAFEDLLNAGFRLIPPNFNNNVIQAAIAMMLIYVLINLALGFLATWLEKRSRRSRKTAAAPITAAALPDATMGGGAARL